MSRSAQLSQWTTVVSTHLPHLSKPQATILAWWSFGIACTRTCGRSTVATFLALLLHHKVANVEQRLYEWCLDAPDKAGRKRTAVVVETCFVPLLRWIVSLWSSEQIALSVDATSLRDQFVVLAVCVVYRGCAIPVAWTILEAGTKHAWRREWFRMVRLLRPAIPRAWTVLVLADRGLYARWLFRRIVRLGWHPFLRMNQGCTLRPHGQAHVVWLRDLVGEVGERWRGRGTAFASRESQLECTLVAWWGAGYAEPWFVLTDLAPEGSDAVWYGLRGWCEQSVTCLKRGGWQWQQTQMTDPARAARLWLALAVATLWMLTLGSELELEPDAECPDLPDLQALLGTRYPTHARRIRLFRLGWLWFLVRLIEGQPIPVPRRLVPEPWPAISDYGSVSIPQQKALADAAT